MAEIKFSSVKKKKLSIDDSLYLFFPVAEIIRALSSIIEIAI